MNIFKEQKLSQDFAKEKIQEAKRLIELSTPFTVVGMPTMGVSFFLKFLSLQKFGYFIHIDINELPKLDKTEFLKLVLKELSGKYQSGREGYLMEKIKAELFRLKEENNRIVLVFNRFDRLQKEFDQNFFANLRTIWEVDKEKIVLVFTANRPLTDIAPEAISGGNFNLCSQTLYLKPYGEKDLIELIKINAPNLLQNEISVKKALALSGGHYQLFILLLKSDTLENPLEDPAIRFQLKDLFSFLNTRQQSQLRELVLGKKIKLDSFLFYVGFIKKVSDKYDFFSPLLKSFILDNTDLQLPQKEARLFKLLKSKNGKIISKDQIFEKVWSENPEEASDWALDSLVYRLRKKLELTEKYSIQSIKKQGYVLITI